MDGKPVFDGSLSELPECRQSNLAKSLQHGFAVFDAENHLLSANAPWFSVFDGIEDVKPGIQYINVLRILTEEGIVDTGARSPDLWRERMLTRWQSEVLEPVVIRLWTGDYIKLIDQRSGDGGVVGMAVNVTDNMRAQTRLLLQAHLSEAEFSLGG
ncbi:MAG: PAS-domain containing protein [Pseudomonadota bacterium]